MKWKEVPNVVVDLLSLLKDKRRTWQKSAQGSVDEHARATISRGLKRIRQIGEEEETVRELVLENLDRYKGGE